MPLNLGISSIAFFSAVCNPGGVISSADWSSFAVGLDEAPLAMLAELASCLAALVFKLVQAVAMLKNQQNEYAFTCGSINTYISDN